MSGNFLDLVNQRTSVRDFSDQPIEKEKIDYIMEAVRLAPSAVNFQPYSFIIVTDNTKLKQLTETYNREWFKTAPACVVACGNHEHSWHRQLDGKDHCDIDVAIAVTHLIMAATEQGLGTCWVCNFNKYLCAEIFSLPSHVEPIALIPLGYPANPEVLTGKSEKKRKSLKELIIS